MVFEKETNLYQDAAIRSKFTSQDTQFSVIQGKISYLITDSEIATYDDGKGTITSRMNSAENTVSEHSSTISSMQSEIDGVTGDVEEFHSTYNAFVQNTEGTFSEVSSTIATKTHVFRDQPAPPYNEGDFWIKDKELYVCVNSKEESESYSASDWIPSTKGRVFTTTPTVPYNAGDMWMQGASGDIKICTVTRTSGSYSASDWSNASRYIGTSDITTWYNNNLKDIITGLEDGEVSTYYQTSDPSGSWTASEKPKHEGDIWYNSTSTVQKYYRYNGSSWDEMKATPPDAIVQTVDKKANIYTGSSTPSSPKSGDLWFKGADQPILTYVNNSWQVYNKYTDDSAFTTFRDGTYATFVTNTGNALNTKTVTYYQASAPSTHNTGDLWIDTDDKNKLYRWNGTTWQNDQDAQIQDALTNAATAKSIADRKIVTFAQASQPSGTTQNPLDVGDLWIDTDDNNKIYRYSGSAWTPYTDSSALNAFTTGTYATFVNATNQSLAKKITTFYQSSAPSGAISGDLWIDTGNGNILKRYSGSSWTAVQDAGIQNALNAAGDAQATADGKIMTYAQASAPSGDLDVGDLWIETDNNNRMYRWSGSSWVPYTDTYSLNDWLTNTYSGDKSSLQTQIDGKVETFSQTSDPSSSWNASDKAKHKGDLWYNSTSNVQKYYRYTGSEWTEIRSEPPSAMVTTINNKSSIYTGSTRPSPPYKIGDLWFNSTADNTGNIYTCVTARSSGTGLSSDWKIRHKYTDDSTFTNWQTETYDSFINQLPGQINFQVTGSRTTAAGDVYTGKGDIILNINDTLQSEAKIDADKITLDGDLVVNAINDGSVQINASHIAISSYPSLDSAIDSKSGIYKGDAVPTNSNSPASGWTTDAVRAKHVSDIYVRTNGDEYQYVPGKNGLLITFSSKCSTERNYDFAQIYFQINGTTYKTGALTGGRGGTENKIAGVQVFVPSNIFWLYWESDSSNTDYGFSIDSIEKVYSDKAYATSTGTLPSITATEVSGDTYPETAHPYTNNQKLLWKYTYSSSAFEDQTYGWARRQDSGFNEIRMQGYVTFTNLGTSGATAINGDNITTGTINADRVMGGTFKAGGSAAGSSGKDGVFEVYSSADARIGRIDSSGIYFGNIISSLSSPNFKVDNSGYVTCKGATVTTAADSQACNMQLSTSELSLYRNGVRIGSVGFEINQNSAFATLSGSASAKIKNSTSSAFVGCDSNGHITLGTGRYGKVYVQNTYDQGRYSVALTNENTEIIFNVQNNRLYIVSGGATYYLTLNR